MTIGAAKAFEAVTLVGTRDVATKAILARLKIGAFVDIQVTMVTDVARSVAITAIVVEKVNATAFVTRLAVAFINLLVTIRTSVAHWTNTRDVHN